MRGYITDREDCCHRTCFSLQFNGVPLDHFAELRSIEGLKDGVTLKVVEEVRFFKFCLSLFQIEPNSVLSFYFAIA